MKLLVHHIFCEWRKQNKFNNETARFQIDKAMMVLPDAIFCHKFMAILGEDIRQYLFDKDFEVTGINMCTNCILTMTLALIFALRTISKFSMLSHPTKVLKFASKKRYTLWMHSLELYLHQKETTHL
jgi:hypothetical protein